MTDRDQFAAAALTGLLVHANDGIDEETLDTPSDIAYTAYAMADAMLREREKLSDGDSIAQNGERCRGGSDCPSPDNVCCAVNHDAAPAATAPEPEPEPAARRRPAGGTGDTRESLSGSLPADLGDGVSPSENDKNLHHTQEIAAYRRFVGEVMNWVSEATGFLHDDVLRTDYARDIIADACSRCWDAFDRIALTDHGASPEARAESDEDRADKAATSHRRDGTGDTPATHATHGEGSVRREGTEPVAWGVANGKGLLATSISRIDAVDMQSEYEFVTEVIPLYRQAPDFAPPPPDNAAKAPDNAEPVAWGVVYPNDEVAVIAFKRKDAEERATASDRIVPLYRHPPCQDVSQKNLTLTDAEREAVERASIAYELLPTEGAQQVSATLRGLLERLGGGR